MPRIKKFRTLIALHFCILTTFLFLEYLFQIFQQPYLWDELGVYARAATRMYHDGLSLMPDAIPDELSRGHPLLCTFYFALAFKLFGCSTLVGHFAAAFLHILTFHFLFLIFKRLMNEWMALLGTLICFLQPAFLSQSILVLPEMPLMFCTVLAIYAFLENRILLQTVALSAALQIKESALVLPLAFVLADLYRKSYKPDWKFIALTLGIPVLLLSLFFVAQYLQRGYVFYPLHTSLVKFEWYYVKERWRDFSYFFFFDQGHWIWLFTLALTLIFYAKKVIALPKSYLIFPMIILGGIGFQLLNYFLSRYNLFILLPYMALVFILAQNAFGNKTAPMAAMAVMILGLSICHLKGRDNYTDVNFSYVPHIRNLQATVTELNSRQYQGKRIQLGFPLAACYFDKENGYNYRSTFEVLYQNSDTADYKVFTFPGNMDDTLNNGQAYHRVKTIRNGEAYSVIYKKD